MVAETLLVFIGGIVLLIDDNHAKAVERGEESTSRPHGDRCFARSQSRPLLKSFAGSKSAMEHRQSVSKPRSQAGHDLVGERNFRNQNQGLTADLQGRRHGPEVDLSFAAARYAVEQHCAGLSLPDRFGDRLQRVRLVGGEIQRNVPINRRSENIAGLELVFDDHEAALSQCAQNGGGGSRGQ